MKTYSEKLKDPRWQKKRLEVMEASKFTCDMCRSTEKTLHVHHVNYRKGAKPWDYELNEFKCLCEDCHKLVESNIFKARILCSHAHPVMLETVLFWLLEASIDMKIEKEMDSPERLLKRALAEVQAEYICGTLTGGDLGNQRDVAAVLCGSFFCKKPSEPDNA